LDRLVTGRQDLVEAGAAAHALAHQRGLIQHDTLAAGPVAMTSQQGGGTMHEKCRWCGRVFGRDLPDTDTEYHEANCDERGTVAERYRYIRNAQILGIEFA
jgi:hypothetical protein